MWIEETVKICKLGCAVGFMQSLMNCITETQLTLPQVIMSITMFSPRKDKLVWKAPGYGATCCEVLQWHFQEAQDNCRKDSTMSWPGALIKQKTLSNWSLSKRCNSLILDIEDNRNYLGTDDLNKVSNHSRVLQQNFLSHEWRPCGNSKFILQNATNAIQLERILNNLQIQKSRS